MAYYRTMEGALTGAYTFANSLDANNDSGLKARQRTVNGQTQTSFYWIRATPYRKSGLGYPKQDGGSVMDFKDLGTIS